MQCNILLHDDGMSSEDVLCSPQVLIPGTLGTVTDQSARNPSPYYFISKPLEKSAERNGVQLSIHSTIAKVFGFRNQTIVAVAVVKDEQTATATHIELTFRDQYLSRADMWRIASSSLYHKTIYRGQRLLFLDSVKATVNAIFVKGREVLSAHVTSRTKPIFRSESARFVIYLQMSTEMWEWDELSGKIMFEKAVDGYLSELFERWNGIKARHTVTVVLFGRHSTYESETEALANTITDDNQHTDLYQVVVSEVSSSQANMILKKVRHCYETYRSSTAQPLLPAAESDILQAISLLSSSFSDPNTDHDLVRTGFSVIVVTAGPGIFQSDYKSLIATTDLLMGNGTGVDLVSVAPKPLHPVPLWYYIDPQGGAMYALPHWCDVSFWEDSDTTSERFKPSFRLDVRSGFCDVAIPLLEFRELQSPENNDYDVFCRRRTGTANASNESSKSNPASTKALPTDGQAETGHLNVNEALRPRQGSGKVMAPRRTFFPRQISLGAPGLGLSKSAASTTVSVEHAQIPRTGSFVTNQTSSALSRQIRQSVHRRDSQQSLVQDTAERITALPAQTTPQPIQTLAPPTRPLDIDASKIAGSEHHSNGLATENGEQDRRQPGLSLTANSPWLTLSNPGNPTKDNMSVAPQHRHWQNVYPKPVASKEFKWASMCSPAALPLTNEFCPSESLLRSDYVVHTHTVSGDALEELIAFRLEHGFQFVRRLEASTHPDVQDSPLAILSSLHQAKGKLGAGVEILMTLGDTLHELVCHPMGDIEIKVYSHKTASTSTGNNTSDTKIKYMPLVRTSLSKDYLPMTYNCRSSLQVNDWENFDRTIAGMQDGHPADLRVWRARFVLIPVDPPKHTHSTRLRGRGLSDEERRLDAIQRLTQAWQRARHSSPEDRQHQASLHWRDADSARAKDANPLAIDYQTSDPSAVVHAYGAALAEPLQAGDQLAHLFNEADTYHSSEFDVLKIAQHLQEPPPKGVLMKDRRWYTKMHLNCFRGDEMTNWVLRNFKDMETRDEAVQLGDVLMKRGLFSHVQQKHDFRDGNYFYQVSAQYRTSEYPDTAGFFRRRPGKSAPSTPVLEAAKDSPLADRADSRRRAARPSESSGEGVAFSKADLPRLELSRLLRYNVDSSHKSSHAEVVDLHYDRIHNPENCYHIRIEWTYATSRLIEESISRWANLVENDGLKLVEVPITEACAISKAHPLELPHRISLAVSPPEQDLAHVLGSPNLAADHPIIPNNLLKAILRSQNFVLDLESANSFATAGVDVTYSWGKPDYTLTQFIHESGTLLAQITPDGDFLVLANRLAGNRRVASTTTAKFDRSKEHIGPGMSTLRPSPLFGAVDYAGSPASGSKEGGENAVETAESVKDALEAFCHDAPALEAFYRRVRGERPVPEVVVPPMDLNK